MDKNIIKTEQELEAERKHKHALKIGTWSAIFLIIFIVVVSFFFIGHNLKTTVLSYSSAQCPIPISTSSEKIDTTKYPDCPIPEKKSFLSVAAAILGWSSNNATSTQSSSNLNGGGYINSGEAIGGGDLAASCTRVDGFIDQIHSTTGPDHVTYQYTLFCDRGISTLDASDNVASTTMGIYSGGSVGGGDFGGGDIASGGDIPSGGTI